MSIYIGDCREVMKQLIADGVKVQMCVTSPPYWGLRDYGVEGQLGLEKTPEEYVSNMVEVFRLVRELLADDGTLWLNLGDSYFGSNCGYGDYRGNKSSISIPIIYGSTKKPQAKQGKPKDLVGIPWRTAFALQSDGWYLRSDIIWHKPNPMPESVKDRPTKSHEYIFLFSKNGNYYYDYKAILEKANYDGRKDTMMKGSNKYKNGFVPNQTEQSFHVKGHERWKYKNLQEDGQQPNSIHLNRLEGKEYLSPIRNKRSVWTVPTSSYKEAHFATFPPNLIKPCILAGSKSGDTVLDPFFGSGTVGEICEQYGRKWIGIDLNPKYYEMQKKRIAQMGIGI